MSGHSKWATIRHKKGAQDAKRGKVFSKIIKEITIAARLGGGELESNPRLRTAITKAKGANMPKDNIDRAIKKGTGELGGADYVELSYEGYGPGGVAILIDALTDNKNRTAADVRSILAKNGGNLGENGCVSYLFNRKGVIAYSAERYSEDEIMEVALEAGADDVADSGGTIEVTTAPDDFEAVLEALGSAGFEHDMAEISRVPDATVSLDPEKTRKAIRLIELLDDHDDVQEVATNLDIPDDFDPEG
ncbi:DNA-binding regulatory protein, YebC/PmpR family [Alkalispirochaeta americana]|uniref:Probable transcriptional regulatory protein SAMN05920897_102197 n=1 Tax=Alkalispirochaeta americana TaxID=159291 RepID=A0A1N6P9H9_9SPIO|nr:YebC/PmpR family DNA-binding transcriptional regulator [Alkalispirochaeta americana]SIQ01024.1 DNA-binding regulatory protein, YebC/PmpR family [Alkalispirochaeta americana]